MSLYFEEYEVQFATAEGEEHQGRLSFTSTWDVMRDDAVRAALSQMELQHGITVYGVQRLEAFRHELGMVNGAAARHAFSDSCMAPLGMA